MVEVGWPGGSRLEWSRLSPVTNEGISIPVDCACETALVEMGFRIGNDNVPIGCCSFYPYSPKLGKHPSSKGVITPPCLRDFCGER